MGIGALIIVSAIANDSRNHRFTSSCIFLFVKPEQKNAGQEDLNLQFVKLDK